MRVGEKGVKPTHTHTHLLVRTPFLLVSERLLFPVWARATRMCKTVTVHPVDLLAEATVCFEYR